MSLVEACELLGSHTAMLVALARQARRHGRTFVLGGAW